MKKLKCDRAKPTCFRCSQLEQACSYDRKNDPNFVPLNRTRTKSKSNLAFRSVQRKVNKLQQELAAENLAIQQVEQQKKLQLKNSQLQQILLQFGLQNSTSEELHLQLYPPEPRIIQSRDELPYPPEIIDDLVESYFENSHWPLNFLHESSFMANKYKIPRALLCIICARGYRYSKFRPFLYLQGNIEEELLQLAKNLFDYEDISMDSLIINIQFCFLYKDLGKNHRSWIYVSSFLSLVKIMKLYEDPDIIELESGKKFNLIEKEMRRRVWWLLRIMTYSQNTILNDYPVHNVRIPLSLGTFESLSENQGTLLSLALTPGSQKYDVETIAIEMVIWRERLTLFHTKICERLDISFDLFETLIQATKIQSEFQLWFDGQPDWFRNVMDLDNIYVNKSTPKDPNQISWLAPNLHLLFHALSVFPYRFLLVFISGSKSLDSQQKHLSKEFISVAIEFCLNHQKSLFSILKNCILRLDPDCDHIFPINLFTLEHFSIFTSIMSQFGETEEVRSICSMDFKFTIEYFKKVALLDECKYATQIVNELEIFDRIPPGAAKTDVIFNMWNKNS
ncbi:hypothetical protein HK096_009213 [Nowakowskiella sp. JEL0078]|nr:hypothetical protein HK096_009213 [Nowakowskiella sp. JEL0078]